MATVGGLIGAGVAFALQKFSIGDRIIIIGGVRGEVIALDFFQTTVLEMGQPPSVESQTDPAMMKRSASSTQLSVILVIDARLDSRMRCTATSWRGLRNPA